MRYHFEHLKPKQGMTLIEVLLYIALLSMLLFGFISYLYSLNEGSMDLFSEVSNAYVE